MLSIYGKVPVCLPLTLSPHTLYCHCISSEAFLWTSFRKLFELIQIFKALTTGCDVGFCVWPLWRYSHSNFRKCVWSLVLTVWLLRNLRNAPNLRAKESVRPIYFANPKTVNTRIICDPPQDFDAKGESTLTRMRYSLMTARWNLNAITMPINQWTLAGARMPGGLFSIRNQCSL